jgi:ATP-binding protein involved in chromosome partitioning
MIQQFIGAVQWGELDYLLIDLPPGTGDVQITLAQTASLTGAVIVTTPQQVALEVAKRGVKMFAQVNVPVLGIIENMSGFTCPECGHMTRIFKTGGGKDLADNLGLPFLGALPLDPEIMVSGEEGAPLVTRDPDSPAARAFLDLAASVKKASAMISGSGDTFSPQKFEVTPQGNLAVQWTPSDKRELSAYDLRVKCPCASCVDEDTGKRTLDPKQVSLDIKIKSASPVGRYGIAIAFSDGHDTGIYRFDYLREIEKEADAGGDKSSFDL